MDYELCDGCILSRVSFYFIQGLCLSLYRRYGMFYEMHDMQLMLQ